MLQTVYSPNRGNDVFLERVSSSIDLTDNERSAIKNYTVRFETRPRGALIAEEGDHARRSYFMISGWALRQTFLSDGRRQIFGFLLPGDPIEPFSCLGEAVPGGVVAVTAVHLVDTTKTTQDDYQAAHLDRFYFIVARQHLHYARNQLLRLGCHNAYQRIAHFLLEMHDRLSEVGLVTDGSFLFPLTQEMLADSLGLSVVHVNRTMKQLREADLVQFKAGSVHLRNRKKLKAICEYVSVPGHVVN